MALDPYTGTLLRQTVDGDTWYAWLEKGHGTLLIGTTGDRLLEIAAGLGLVMHRALPVAAPGRPAVFADPDPQPCRTGPGVLEILARGFGVLDLGPAGRLSGHGHGLGRDLGR